MVDAISASLCAIASCFPISWPHCERAAAHFRETSRRTFAPPTTAAGSDSRPVLSVVSAILSPRPSSPIRFSAGTFTSVNWMAAFASARSPMNRQRCVTSTPGHDLSTMNALIAFVRGFRAITTSSSAIVPFVHQSFEPFRT